MQNWPPSYTKSDPPRRAGIHEVLDGVKASEGIISSGVEAMGKPQDVAVRLRLLELGWGTRRIASALGVSRNNVHRWVEARELQPPYAPSGRKRPLDADQAFAARGGVPALMGLSQGALARSLSEWAELVEGGAQ